MLSLSLSLSEHERDRYRNVVEFPPRNETYGHDEDVHARFPASESFTCLENFAYPGLRNRGGSDDNRDSTKRESAQSTNDVEETRRSRHHCNPIPRRCTACCAEYRESRAIHFAENRSSQRATASHHESSSVITDYQIRADVPGVCESDPLHRAPRSASASRPEDNNGRAQTFAILSEVTRSREQIVACENAEFVPSPRIEGNPKIAGIADATVSSTKTKLAVRSSRKNAPTNESVASTSKWTPSPPPVSSEVSRDDRSASAGSPSFATSKKFRGKRTAVGNKARAPVFKHRGSSVGGKGPSAKAAVGRDSGARITQIELSTVQTTRKGNKERTRVNVPARTFDAIVARILSEFLVSGAKRKRVLMTITLQSDADRDDVSDVAGRAVPSRDAETQTSSSDVTAAGIYALGHPSQRPRAASKIVPCLACDKRDCYEIKRSDEPVSLEEALIAEYPETSEFYDHPAQRRTDLEAPTT